MAYTTPRTRVTGEINTAAQFNSDITANLSAIAYKPHALVLNNATQSFSNNLVTDAVYNTTIHSSDGMVTGSPSLTVNTAGLYVCINRLQFASNTTGRRYLQLVVSGTVTGTAEQSAATFTGLEVVYMAALTAGQTIKGQAFQTSGAALGTTSTGLQNATQNVYYSLQACWLGG